MSDTPEDKKPEDDAEVFPIVKAESTEIVEDEDNVDDGTSGIRTETDHSILERIKKRTKHIGIEFALLGRDLFLCEAQKAYETAGHETFEDYCWNGLGMPVAQGRRLVDIFHKYVYECAVPLDELKKVGVTKATIMLHTVNKTNIQDWLQRAQSETIKVIRREVRAEKDKDKRYQIVKVENSSPLVIGHIDPLSSPAKTLTPIEPYFPDPSAVADKVYPNLDPTAIPGGDEGQNPVKKEFVVFPGQYEQIQSALRIIAEDSGSKSDAHNLCMILSEWQARRVEYKGVKDAKPRTLLDIFETAFGGKVAWVRTREAWAELIRLIEDNNLKDGITYE